MTCATCRLYIMPCLVHALPFCVWPACCCLFDGDFTLLSVCAVLLQFQTERLGEGRVEKKKLLDITILLNIHSTHITHTHFYFLHTHTHLLHTPLRFTRVFTPHGPRTHTHTHPHSTGFYTRLLPLHILPPHPFSLSLYIYLSLSLSGYVVSL